MPPANDLSDLRRGPIRYLPVVPGRLEFACHVREQILNARPQFVALDLPVTLASCYERAIERLPELSVIIYDDEGADRVVYETVEPADPFVEALRTAREVNAKTVFLDPDVAERSGAIDAYPDSYAVERIGFPQYIASYRKNFRERTGSLTVHAEALASQLQAIDLEAETLVVVELKLLDPLLEAMERPQARPLRKVRRKGVRLLNLHPECLTEVLTEMPFLQSIYEARRSNRPRRFSSA